jgi:hypothetical protein
MTPGAYSIGGNLFFKLPDGSTVSCECIKSPYAEKIVELFNGGSHVHAECTVFDGGETAESS